MIKGAWVAENRSQCVVNSIGRIIGIPEDLYRQRVRAATQIDQFVSHIISFHRLMVYIRTSFRFIPWNHRNWVICAGRNALLVLQLENFRNAADCDRVVVFARPQE